MKKYFLGAEEIRAFIYLEIEVLVCSSIPFAFRTVNRSILPRSAVANFGPGPTDLGASERLSVENRAVKMFDLFSLTDAQMAHLEPFFPKSNDKPRVGEPKVCLIRL
jgi:hypothetical protein